MADVDPRQRLLDAALRLFADRGYAGTAVQDIVEAAGVTKPVLYYHFESKGGLFQALIDRAVEERLRLMQAAAPAHQATVTALTDIVVALTRLARQQADLLRLSFAVVFAAPGELPAGFRLPPKIGESIRFVHDLIQAGRESGELNSSFTTHELVEGYFQMVQHQVAVAVLNARRPPPGLPPLPPPATPERAVALFLAGAAPRKSTSHRGGTAAKSLLAAALLGLLPLGAHAQAMKAKLPTDPGVSTNVVPTAPVASNPNAPVAGTNGAPSEIAPDAPPEETPVRASGPTTADVRPVPLAVRASHPELATVSPIEANAHDPHALDLETCFQLTAIRDDSLKIDLEDIEVARAQLSQSIAALWPSFTATNQQDFLHYSSPAASSVSLANLASTSSSSLGTSSTGTSVGTSQSTTGLTTETTGNQTHTSQSNITMSYTLFNGGQNYNTVGASRAAVAAKRETLAREYETIYQDVAQGFYNALQYEGDMVIEHDLIEALGARVDDLMQRVKLGRSRPSEMLQAQTDLANARVTYEQQVGSANAALETVAFYIGIPAGHFKLKDTGRFPSAQDLEYYLQRSGTRPDILSQVDSLRQAERNLSVARGELFPTVTANGDYLAQQDPASNNVDATMSLQISIPIFDGGLILGQIHEKHELVRQSALNVEQLARTADQDTRTAYVNFQAAVAQVVVLREAARFAARNLEAQVEDYRRGVVSNLDVLTALQDYQTARVQLHNANMTARVDLINLHVAAGMAARGPGADNRALPAHVEGVAR
jgi:outer membrane protein